MSEALGNFSERITQDSGVMLGKAVIRGTRLTVEFILGLLAAGATTAEIIDEYEGLTEADIQACLHFARLALTQTSVVPLTGETA